MIANKQSRNQFSIHSLLPSQRQSAIVDVLRRHTRCHRGVWFIGCIISVVLISSSLSISTNNNQILLVASAFIPEFSRPVVVVPLTSSSSSSSSTTIHLHPHHQHRKQKQQQQQQRRLLPAYNKNNYEYSIISSMPSIVRSVLPSISSSVSSSVSSVSSSSLYMSKKDPNMVDNIIHKNDNVEEKEEDYNNPQRDQWYVPSTMVTMIAAQATFIPIGIVLANIIGIDLHFGDMIKFVYDVSSSSSSSSRNIVVWYGILSTIPLFIFAYVLDFIEDQIPALQEVSIATQRSLYTILGGSYKPIRALFISILLGIIAGIGEEILFRGILQQTLYDHLYMDFTTNNTAAAIMSVVLSSIIFGLFHAATPMYVVLATIASMYFGTLYNVLGNGNDLTIPILCHAIYDVGALFYAHYTVSHLSFQQLQQLLFMNANDDTKITTTTTTIK